MNTNEFDFNIQLYKKDFFHFVLQYCRTKSKIITFFIIGGYTFCLLSFITLSILERKLAIGPDIIIFLILLPIIITLFIWWIACYTFKSNKAFAQPQHYNVTHEAIQVTGADFNTEYKTTLLNDVTFSKKHAFLWISSSSACIIPLRDLTSQQLEQLKQWAIPFMKSKK